MFNALRSRALTVVDVSAREALVINVDQGIKDETVARVTVRFSPVRGAPKIVRVGDEVGFISKALDRWAYENSVTLNFSRPGEPTRNALVGSFNGEIRDECLNTH